MFNKIDIEKPHLPLYVWIIVLASVLFVGCSNVTPEIPPAEDVESETDANWDVEFGLAANGSSLRGNPKFFESQLPQEARMWYKRMWAAIKRSSSNTRGLAASGDLHKYGKRLNMHNTALLTAFRVTGDLRLLDEIDRSMQFMRGKLKDAWLDGTRDGYLNWLYLHSNNKKHKGYGKDTRGALDDVLTHAHVAAMAYAFHVNRDLKSPSGVNYAERARFWTNYLKNHFEAKWRKRNARSITYQKASFPFLKPNTNHAYTQWLRYHYYMYKLTGDKGYQNELVRMGKVIEKDYLDKITPVGKALLFEHQIVSDPRQPRGLSSGLGLQATTYVQYSASAAMELHLEGVDPFNKSFMQKFAATLSHYILDSHSSTIAVDVGGGKDVKADNGRMLKSRAVKDRGFRRPSRNTYSTYPLAVLTAYDTKNNKIRNETLKIYQRVERSSPDNPQRVHIPAAMVFTLLHK